MTVHRVKMCSCGHEESWHDKSGCKYGHGHAMGGCSCTKFSKRRRADGVKPNFVRSSMPTPIEQAIDDIIHGFTALKTALVVARSQPIVDASAARELSSPSARAAARSTSTTNGAIKLRAGERRMLEVLARHRPAKLTRAQLGTLAGLAAGGGTFSTYLSVLARHGLVEQPSELVALTSAGLKLAGGRGKPMTRAEILDVWRSKLRKGERAMLDAVLSEGELTRDELGDLANIETRGGTFGSYLSVLKRNDLVVTVGNKVRLGTALAEAS